MNTLENKILTLLSIKGLGPTRVRNIINNIESLNNEQLIDFLRVEYNFDIHLLVFHK